LPNLDINRRIREAAEAGDSFAQFEMALDLDLGIYGDRDSPKAAEYYLKAADQGHQGAKNNLLLQHILGESKGQPPEAVFAQLKTAAETGDRDAQNNLGLCFELGYSTAQDYGQAAMWYRRAAEGGLASAQFNLGGFYYEGKGLEKDLCSSLIWYTKAAEQRHELALLRLGWMYQKGFGVEMNLRRAALLYLIAYKQGSARAANHLGLMFKKGLGVEQNDSLAFALFLESVNRPDVAEAPKNLSYSRTAYYWLGRMTENGEGTRRDPRAAKRWYSRGAACGASGCVEALGRLNSKTVRKGRKSKTVN